MVDAHGSALSSTVTLRWLAVLLRIAVKGATTQRSDFMKSLFTQVAAKPATLMPV